MKLEWYFSSVKKRGKDMKQATSKRKLQAMETREKIFNAAIALVEEKGIKGFTIDDIQARTGCSRGLFYNYFRSIDDIVSAIVGVNETQYQIIRDNYLAEARGIEKILLFIQYAAALHTNPMQKEHICIHYINLIKNERQSKLIMDESRSIFTILLEALQECEQDGLLVPGTDLRQAAWDIIILLRGSILQYLFCGDAIPYSLVEQARRLTASYLAGIHAEGICIPIPAIGDTSHFSIASTEYFAPATEE